MLQPWPGMSMIEKHAMSCLTPFIAPGSGNMDSDADRAQRRVEARSNIFVVAALASASGTGPVRIRNMSRTGALIEGGAIPAEGSRVRLSRGSLSATGEMVWQRENRGGVRFDSGVAVSDWLPGGKSATGQQRVDEIVYSYKAEIGGMRPAAPAPAEGRPDIGKELLEVRAVLNSVAEELASDDATTARHPNALQQIDMAAQKLEKLARDLSCGAGLAL